MDYSKMSDFEIESAVSDVLNIPRGDKWCSDWDLAGPIIQQHGIGLRKQSNGIWVATQPGGNWPKYHDNPLRAAMIVFLQMSEAKDDQ